MEEILMNILSRLPVKSLFRFNCVSKFWKTLICETYFKKKHLNHAKNQLSSQKLLFSNWDPNGQLWSCYVSLVMEDISVSDFNTYSNTVEIIFIALYSSCDGLFLVGIWTESDDEQPSRLVIWNPSTRQSTRLPHSRFPRNYSDDEDRGSTYGLAYDSTSDDYKIFRIDISGKKDNEILALKSGFWRIIDAKISGRTLLMGGDFLAFVDGAFHWLGFSSKVCLISFNISDEMYGEMSLPKIVSSQLTLSKFDNVEVQVDVDVGVSVLRGMLGVYYKDDKDFNLWVMKKYGSWMKLLTIPSAGFYKIIPTYAFSDDQVLLCFNKETWVAQNRVRTEYIYRIISVGSSDRMFPQEYYDIGVTCDGEGFPFTETFVFPKLGH